VHCYRLLGSAADAEDALQETLLSAWQGLPAFQRRASIRTWLYRIPFLVADLSQILMGTLKRGVADQDVDPAELLHGAVNDRPTVRGVGDVAGDQYRGPSGVLDPFPGVFSVFVLVEVGDDYVRALAGEGDRHRLNDAAVGAGHYRGFPSQVARTPVAGFAMIWYRVHLLLDAWRVLLLCWLAGSSSRSSVTVLGPAPLPAIPDVIPSRARSSGEADGPVFSPPCRKRGGGTA
jgi:hypothetical protein